MEEAKEHFHHLLTVEAVNGGYNTQVLCQEFLRGKEYVIDHVSRNGVHKTMMVCVLGLICERSMIQIMILIHSAVFIVCSASYWHIELLGMGIRQTTQEWKSVCIFWHVAY